MRLRDLNPDEFKRRLATDGVVFELGTAVLKVRSDLDDLSGVLQLVYGAFRDTPAAQFADVTVSLRRARGLRGLIRPQIELWMDGAMDFEPFPRDTTLPLLEWGMNYALATRLSAHLLLHAGALSRADKGILLPAMPGSGKSTLTAALKARGYRLLSDEFGVIQLTDGRMLPLPRPIALKNESIALVRQLAPDALIGPSFPKTRKGTVAHLAPSDSDVDARDQSVTPCFVVFPQFVRGSDVIVQRLPPTRAFARLAVNSFNYEILGAPAFDAMCDLVARCDCLELRYGELEGAMRVVDGLLDGLTPLVQ